jgi:predicted ribosomally synthesized peptide with SipW-like signal peptide
MRNTLSALALCMLAVIGFVGGAATYAELTDTETEEITVAAGTWTPTETAPSISTVSSTSTSTPTMTEIETTKTSHNNIIQSPSETAELILSENESMDQRTIVFTDYIFLNESDDETLMTGGSASHGR